MVKSTLNTICAFVSSLNPACARVCVQDPIVMSVCDRSIFASAVFAELETLIGIGLRGFTDEVSLLCSVHYMCVCVSRAPILSLPLLTVLNMRLGASF